MPIPVEDLLVSVVADAAWGNAKEQPWIEDSPEDYWQEQADGWVRHHAQPRRTPSTQEQHQPDRIYLTEYRTVVKFGYGGGWHYVEGGHRRQVVGCQRHQSDPGRSLDREQLLPEVQEGEAAGEQVALKPK